jgi:hypothetical protein
VKSVNLKHTIDRTYRAGTGEDIGVIKLARSVLIAVVVALYGDRILLYIYTTSEQFRHFTWSDPSAWITNAFQPSLYHQLGLDRDEL